jgi:hypothetical protein
VSLVAPLGRPTARWAGSSWPRGRGGRFGEGLVRRYGPGGLRRAHHQAPAAIPPTADASGRRQPMHPHPGNRDQIQGR